MIIFIATTLLSLIILGLLCKATIPIVGLLSHTTISRGDGDELPGDLRRGHYRYTVGNHEDFMERLMQLLTKARITGSSLLGLDVLQTHPDRDAAWHTWYNSRGKNRIFLPVKDNPGFSYKGPQSVTELSTYPNPGKWRVSLINWLPVVWNYEALGHGNTISTIEAMWMFRTESSVRKLLKKKVWRDNTVFEDTSPSEDHSDVLFYNIYTQGPRLKKTSGVHSCKDIKHLILEEGVLETFHSIIEGFGSSRKLYRTLGIPYKLGVLLQGLPGTGKTSLIKALASYYGVPLYFINMSTMTDELFIDAIEAIKGAKGLIVMEDLDATGVQTNREDSKEINGVKLSQLLNFLDGVDTPEGSVIIITTNHPEKFDSALVRPGRIDHIINMHGLTPERAILVLQNTLAAAELDPHMLDDKFQELFGNEERVQPAAVQQFAQKEIFGYTYQQQTTPQTDSE